MSRRVDLDALARARDERRFLLRSLDDLDAEFAVGDVDEADYRELRDSYVVRAAAALREIESLEAGHAAAVERTGRSSGRALMWVGGFVVFGVVAGVLLAGAAGTRADGEILTGSGTTDRERFANCQSLAFSDPDAGIDCYDELLDGRPDNTEALTYQGWAMYRAGDEAAAVAQFERVVDIDPEYPDVYAFLAVAARDRDDVAAAEAYLVTLEALDPPDGVMATVTQMGLDVSIAEAALPDDVRECWEDERDAIDALSAASTSEDDEGGRIEAGADLLLAVSCQESVLAERPDDLDALKMAALGHSILGGSSLQTALGHLDHAADLAPDDDDVALLRGAIRNMAGDVQGALTDLDRLDDDGISPLYRSIDVDLIRSQVESLAAEE